jgi:hypothetical protein
MISAQNPATVTVNSVLVPTIQINTRIDSTGKLVTGASITLQPAAVSSTGQWTAAGPCKTVSIPDVTNLPSDLASVAAQLATAETDIIALVTAINAIRKLV